MSEEHFVVQYPHPADESSDNHRRALWKSDSQDVAEEVAAAIRTHFPGYKVRVQPARDLLMGEMIPVRDRCKKTNAVVLGYPRGVDFDLIAPALCLHLMCGREDAHLFLLCHTVESRIKQQRAIATSANPGATVKECPPTQAMAIANPVVDTSVDAVETDASEDELPVPKPALQPLPVQDIDNSPKAALRPRAYLDVEKRSIVLDGKPYRLSTAAFNAVRVLPIDGSFIVGKAFVKAAKVSEPDKAIRKLCKEKPELSSTLITPNGVKGAGYRFEQTPPLIISAKFGYYP